MSPAWRGVPAALRLLGGLPLLLLLLLLLLCPHASWGDCKFPPKMPNAQAALEGVTNFPEGKLVTYKCNQGFVKIPGKPDSVICFQGEWSEIEEFCNRSCDAPTGLRFASVKYPYNRQSYFPMGSVVEYECRKGYIRHNSLPGTVTCLQNFTWSKANEFCKKKSCPDPGVIINGHVIITTDILFGASITFSCDTGYDLVGIASSYCIVKGDNVDWSSPLPECKESSPISKVTPTPQKPTTVDVPGTKAPSTPQKPTTVNFSTTEAASAPQELTTVNIPATEFPSSPPKPITANVPAIEAISTPQKPTKINSSATKTLLILQDSTLHDLTVSQKHTSNISVMETPSTPKKPITANDSVTIAKVSPVSNALSTNNLPAAQTPMMANSSAIQATPKTQRLTTKKASFTQHVPVTQKFTAVHAPVIKSLHTTQGLTSAHISATQTHRTTIPVRATTTRFHGRSTPKGKGTPSSGVSSIIYGLVAGTIITGIIILGKIFWDYGKSGTHICNTDSFAYDASSCWLFDLTKEDIRRKCTQRHRIFLVSYKFLEPWTQYVQ
ncbi:complement decay-accelerating factor isoform X2 [Pteronotus mesoamericanus]|uniref:complement decay-accelerating factor isoform X2 n=1 Tax=Pteronotus mesoamericanus TaxID=1884717 RepID=UPI0023EBB4BF|nr:complement decay-accelerating factor isoform X2 [Pteronotus parnellii mesoamericanus]